MQVLQMSADLHRVQVQRYYRLLAARFGNRALLKHLPRLRTIVWTSQGLAQVDKRVSR